MCDYSLMSVPNRLAAEGERLIVHRFSTGTIGLASPAELGTPGGGKNGRPRRSWWKVIKDWLELPPETTMAVCIPPGAQLVLRDIPLYLQDQLNVEAIEQVVLVQVSASEYTHRDAVQFKDGRSVLLQRLREGQRVDVISLGSSDAASGRPDSSIRIPIRLR